MAIEGRRVRAPYQNREAPSAPSRVRVFADVDGDATRNVMLVRRAVGEALKRC